MTEVGTGWDELDFVGADRALKRLSLMTAEAAATPTATEADLPVVDPSTTLRDVLALLLASGKDAAAIATTEGEPRRAVSLSTIRHLAMVQPR